MKHHKIRKEVLKQREEIPVSKVSWKDLSAKRKGYEVSPPINKVLTSCFKLTRVFMQQRNARLIWIRLSYLQHQDRQTIKRRHLNHQWWNRALCQQLKDRPLAKPQWLLIPPLIRLRYCNQISVSQNTWTQTKPLLGINNQIRWPLKAQKKWSYLLEAAEMWAISENHSITLFRSILEAYWGIRKNKNLEVCTISLLKSNQEIQLALKLTKEQIP